MVINSKLSACLLTLSCIAFLSGCGGAAPDRSENAPEDETQSAASDVSDSESSTESEEQAQKGATVDASEPPEPTLASPEKMSVQTKALPVDDSPQDADQSARPRENASPKSSGRSSPMDISDLIEHTEPAVVRIDVEGTSQKSLGSGFLVKPDNLVVTNHHVIADAQAATVTFKDGRKADVEGVLFVDSQKDLAILKLTDAPADLQSLTFADTLPRKGASVVAFGAPKGLQFSATQGIVSAIREGEEINSLFRAGVEGTWIQTSTPISSGNSGGPLVNMQGEVIGINTMSLVKGQNLNFAISATHLSEALEAARAGETTPLPAVTKDAITPSRPKETVALLIPAKREFQHDYEVRDEIDKFEGTRDISLQGVQAAEGLMLLVHIGVPDENTPPEGLILTLASSSNDWKYLKYRNLKFLCDGTVLDLGKPLHEGKVYRDASVSEILMTVIDLKSFVQLSHADRVEGKLGSTEFRLRQSQLEAFRDVLARIPTGETENGAYRVEQKQSQPSIEPSTPPVVLRDSQNPGSIGVTRRALRIAFEELGSYNQYAFREETEGDQRIYRGRSDHGWATLSLIGPPENLTEATLTVKYPSNSRTVRRAHAIHILSFLKTVTPQWKDAAEWAFNNFDWARYERGKPANWTINDALLRRKHMQHVFGQLDLKLTLVQVKPTTLIRIAFTPAEVGQATSNAAQNEQKAANKLEMAKTLLKRKSDTGKKWLRDIIQEFPDTDAAEEAQQLLEEMK